MTKELSLQAVQKVKQARPDDDIPELLSEIEDYLNSQVEYNYRDMMQFIQSLIPGKLGGKYMYQAKALEFLKNELKALKKKSKTVLQ